MLFYDILIRSYFLEEFYELQRKPDTQFPDQTLQLLSMYHPDQFAYAPMHWHSEFEINFVRTGSAEFTCGEQKFRSADGDIIVIPPNVMHSVYPCPEMHQIL